MIWIAWIMIMWERIKLNKIGSVGIGNVWILTLFCSEGGGRLPPGEGVKEKVIEKSS